jgi:thiamine biosynthesis lipoprotein
MGVPFRIVLYAKDRPTADRAQAAAFKRVEELNAIMSDYEMDSELSRLSRSSGKGRAVPVSPDLWKVLEHAQDVSARSDGAFDVTVGPYVLLWRKARREGRLPDPARLAEAGRSVGYQHVRLNKAAQSVELLVPGMRLDLGGIAKGYAIDAALEALQHDGVVRALVSGGGDMAVSGPPPGKSGWRIELAPLDATNAPPARHVLLARAGLATSGDLFQRLEIEGKRYSHIVDPRTGIGLTDHSLVTVIAPNCFTADGLTKVASVLGPDRGLKIIEENRGASARVVRKPGDQVEVRESSRFARNYDPK